MGKLEFLWADYYTKIYSVFVSTVELRTLYIQELPYMNTFCECILKKIGLTHAHFQYNSRKLVNVVKVSFTMIYYMKESVLLGTKPLVDSIRHFIRDPSGVFSVCHLCECRIVQWRHDSRLLLLLNWFLHIIKRTLHVGSKI